MLWKWNNMDNLLLRFTLSASTVRPYYVAEYSLQNTSDCTIILIQGNVQCHRFMFSCMLTSIVLPMDKGVIWNFKTYYEETHCKMLSLSGWLLMSIGETNRKSQRSQRTYHSGCHYRQQLYEWRCKNISFNKSMEETLSLVDKFTGHKNLVMQLT